ncbi:MAG TPA: LCP family protein [Patescibacteria group bacterium]|nr:LCP family protein [Patescibacteria group bacterium]
MVKRKLKKRKILGIIYVLFLFTLAATVTYAIRTYNKVVVKSPDDPSITLAPTPTPDPLRIRNILLLGYAGGNHEGATLTDTMMLASIRPKENKIILISIPRDIFVPIPISKDNIEKHKINHAFAIGLDDKKYPEKPDKYKGIIGAGNLSRDMVELVTGIHPDNFIAIDFQGFIRIVDILGGVTVSVPYSFEDKYYPIEGLENDICGKSDEDIKALHATLSGQLLEKEFTCRFETIHYDKGTETLDSENALKFVRSRHSDINGSDFGRSLRQQAFLVGVKNKLLSFSTLTKVIPVINTLSDHTLTDIDIQTFYEIAKDQKEIQDVSISTISLNTDNVLIDAISSDKQYILLPKSGEGNWDQIHEFIKKELEKK